MIREILEGLGLVGLVGFAALAALGQIDRPPPPLLIHADYQNCVTVHPGPIHRPDNYSTHPYRRKGGFA